MKERKYNYRRNLPHIEKSGRIHFITFCTRSRWQLPAVARDLVLKHCLHENGIKMQLYIAVVMPDHVHMLFMPFETQNHQAYSFEEIVGAIKGASSHSVNKALKRSGTVWEEESFDHVVRHAESMEAKIQYVRENPVRKGLVANRRIIRGFGRVESAQPGAAVLHVYRNLLDISIDKPPYRGMARMSADREAQPEKLDCKKQGF